MANFKISGLLNDVTKDFQEQLEIIREEDDRAITLDNIDGVNIEDLTIEAIKKEINPKLKEQQIEVSLIDTDLGLIPLGDTEKLEQDLERLKKLVPICEQLKCHYINFSAPIVNKDEIDECYDEVLEQIKKYALIVYKTNVTLVLQHNKCTYAKRADFELHIIDDLKCPNLKINFIPSRYLDTNELPMAAFRLLKDHVAYITASDVNQKRIGVPIGMGEAKIHEILRMAYKNDYKGYVGVKPDLEDYLNRKKLYSKLWIPGYNLVVLSSKRYQTYRKIDKKIGRGKKEEVDPKYLYIIQVRILKKIIERITK